MSQYRQKYDAYEVSWGWDPPLHQFFADVRNSDEDEFSDMPLDWWGDTIEEMKEALKPWHDLAEFEIKLLERDKQNSIEQTPWQKHMAEVFRKEMENRK